MSVPGTLPEAVVVAVLVAASLSLTTPPTANANAFSGAEQPPGAYIPNAAVFVNCYGGAYPITLLGNTQDIRAFDVQILVRGTRLCRAQRVDSRRGEDDHIQDFFLLGDGRQRQCCKQRRDGVQ